MGFMQESASSGDFVPFLKYDARAGRFFSKPEGGGDQYEVTNMTAVMDLDQIQTGWFVFAEGSAPSKVFDPSLTDAAPRPSQDAKRGFQVNMFSDKNIGGLREMCSTAGVVINSMNKLYDEWENAPEKAAGKLPVVKCGECLPIKNAKSTNYQPVFKIVGWADRPAEMPLADAKPAEPSPAKKAGAQHVDPPKQPAPTVDDDDLDF